MSSAEISASNCRNCQQIVTGEFCSHCGQRRNDTLDGRHAVRALAGAALDIEGPWRRTLIDLLVRPNILIRDYLAGARKRYVNPVLMLLLIIAAFHLLATLLGIDLYADARKAKYGNAVIDFMQDFMAYISLALTWPIAAMSGRLWPDTRTAERFMGLLYAQCTGLLFSFLILPLYGRVDTGAISLISFAMTLLTGVYALRSIRPSLIGSVFSAIAIHLLGWLMYFVIAFLGGVIFAIYTVTQN